MHARRVIGALLVLLVLFLTGCETTGGQQPGSSIPGRPADQPEEGAQGIGLGEQAGDAGWGALDDPNSPLANRTIYFDFDSSQVKSEYLDLIAEHGKYLAANPGLRMRVEGHADERGTREYNVGLGERRSQAVQRLLMFQGANKEQAENVSFGEEVPVAFGHDEESWGLNRRVELVYER